MVIISRNELENAKNKMMIHLHHFVDLVSVSNARKIIVLKAETSSCADLTQPTVRKSYIIKAK